MDVRVPTLRERPPILLDWLPWNHAFAHSNFGNVLYNGGSYFIDEGRPAPGMIERTVRNLHDIKPNYFYNVPKGFEALLPFLREDRALREGFFENVLMMFYAAAGLLSHRPATTHWASLDHLGEIDPTIDVRRDERFVDDGDIITAAGVSAGIDMALHLIVRLVGIDRARQVRQYIQYDPAPPV